MMTIDEKIAAVEAAIARGMLVKHALQVFQLHAWRYYACRTRKGRIVYRKVSHD